MIRNRKVRNHLRLNAGNFALQSPNESPIKKITCSNEQFYVKVLSKSTVVLKSKSIIYLQEMFELRNENLNQFKGYFNDRNQFSNGFSLVWLHGIRNTLNHTISNAEINFDFDFIISILYDIINGMKYLHSSAIQYHGKLNSHNCIIDSRWLVKITNFGELQLMETQNLLDNFSFLYNKNFINKASIKSSNVELTEYLLWISPEILANNINNLSKEILQFNDVYSFGIIISELLTRKKPFAMFNLPLNELLEKIIDPFIEMKPMINCNSEKSEIINLMNICLNKNYLDRRDFNSIHTHFRKVFGKSKDIMNNLIEKLQKYSQNLEGLIELRTQLLQNERNKSENLLLRMLPKIVAESLMDGKDVNPEKFDCVTIFFSDIVGFTTISAYSEPIDVINLLNSLYTLLDEIIKCYDVYKVETIGDSYMVVSGLPNRNLNHCEQIADIALNIAFSVRKFKIKHMPDVPLMLRTGIHSGSVVAGVVGHTMPRYCLFGDTVNTASRMEATGRAGFIQISQTAEKLLRGTNKYLTKYRGEILLKGKGKQPTYWLLGKVNQSEQLLDPSEMDEHDSLNEDDYHGLKDLSKFEKTNSN